MPCIQVTTNVPLGAKPALAAALTALFSTALKAAPGHVHVAIIDGAFISLAGDADSAAALVSVKAADGSITADARKAITAGIGAALTQHVSPSLQAGRSYITFEDLPVQNVAVGGSIMTFSTMHTARSVDVPIDDIAP
ncbi:hypothetical protein HT031_003589 [Scenedesmus sp. PABB004]|nr:hypothetical protein HT031_003589 [Scenedesmus sp. PABB004]